MRDRDTGFLCVGTFFALLLQAARQQDPKQLGKKNDFTEADVMRDLALIVNSFEISNAESFNKTVSLYQSCKIGKSKVIPITGATTVNAFADHTKANYVGLVSKMEKIIRDYIDVGEGNRKGTWLVKQLLELIGIDDDIKPEAEFFICDGVQAVKKEQLGGLNGFCLPSFLFGVWHYIILHKPDNSLGADTYSAWHEEAGKSNTKPEFISNIGRGIDRTITVTMPDITENTEGENEADALDDEPFDNGQAVEADEPFVEGNDTDDEQGEPSVEYGRFYEECADKICPEHGRVIIKGPIFQQSGANSKQVYVGKGGTAIFGKD